MKKQFLVSFFAILLLAAPLSAAMETYTVDKVHSDVSFQIKHLISKSRGRFGDFSGQVKLDRQKPELSSVEFTIKTASIDTDQEDRDKHLRSADFFDAEKYPEITFKSSKIRKSAKDKYNVTGTLSMHGVSKVVTLPVIFLGFGKSPKGKDQAGFELYTTLNRKDYGVLWNRALDTGGFVLGEDVAISINLEMNRTDDATPPK